jgi:hypothetical protein
MTHAEPLRLSIRHVILHGIYLQGIGHGTARLAEGSCTDLSFSVCATAAEDTETSGISIRFIGGRRESLESDGTCYKSAWRIDDIEKS